MESKSVAVESLKEFTGNPRKGNIKELVESLKANGQYKPIVVQKSTKQILAGNHLWKAAKELGWTEINIVEIDVDDANAKKIVATDNRLADLGAYDEKLLLDLLGDIDLTGTGYVPADVDDLLALLEEQSTPEWQLTGGDTHQENVAIRPSLADRTLFLRCTLPGRRRLPASKRLAVVPSCFVTSTRFPPNERVTSAK
jgi:hypothetical protein